MQGGHPSNNRLRKAHLIVWGSLFGGGGYPSLASAVAVFKPPPIPLSRGPVGPKSPLSPLVRDQRACAGALPTGAIPVQEISTEASTELVDRLDLRSWDKWSNNSEGTREKGSSLPRAWSKDSFTFMFPLRTGVTLCPCRAVPVGLSGGSGAWPPRGRASTTGPWPFLAA